MSTITSKKEVKTIWDIPLESLYSLVTDFYKKGTSIIDIIIICTHPYLLYCHCCAEKDTIVLDYEQKIRLLAFFKQEKLGPFSSDKDSDTGYFDVVGSHRRYISY